MNHQPQYISKVKISKLWNRFDIEWNLHRDVNILAGGNGSGKSTILDCICSLIDIDSSSEDLQSITKAISLSFDNKKDITFEYIKIDDLIKNIEKKALKDDIYKEVITNIKEAEGANYNKIRRVQVEMGRTSFKDLGLTREELEKLLHIDIISTFDQILQNAESINKLSDDKVKTELDWEIYRLQKQYLDYQLNISKQKDAIIETSPNNFKEEYAKLKEPQDNFLRIIDELFGETQKKINRGKNEIEFLLNNKVPISPYQLSSGEKQLLVILLKVLVQDKKQSILFMDEPEISLHIEWQKKLIAYIRTLNPNVQIIVATHSPALIMDGWMDKVFNVSDLITKKYN